MKIPCKNLVFNRIFIFQISYYYQLAYLAGLMLYTWSPQRFLPSHVNSIKIQQSLASIRPKSNIVAKQFHDASLGSRRSLLNGHFVGKTPTP
jgi:hypothetical protein